MLSSATWNYFPHAQSRVVVIIETNLVARFLPLEVHNKMAANTARTKVKVMTGLKRLGTKC